jgi:peptide/nickel transport system ATP-binding protein
VNHFSDEIAVMYLGKIIEKASAEDLFDRPVHPYTQALLSAIPRPTLDRKMDKIILKGEITSPINPKPVCRFANRCNYAQEICHSVEPELEEIAPDHFVACHLFKE